MRKTQNSTAPLMEAFASLSRKAAGSQGSALSRHPQMAKAPFETRCPTRVSIKLSFKALAAASKTLCAQSALVKNA